MNYDQEPSARMPCVFVVDDEDIIRRGIVQRLTRHHFQVRDFDSGEALLHFAESQDEVPDVVVLDYNLPGLSGLETLKELKERIPMVTAVILTAYKEAVDIEMARNLGVSEIFTKNVELDGIVTIVNGAVAIHKLRNKKVTYSSLE